MAAAPKRPYVTPEEYLEREGRAETKSEYHDGDIVAMAGASLVHNILTFEVTSLLGFQLRAGNCQGFASDQRVRVPACNRYFYPDLTIVCGEPEHQTLAGLESLLNPTLIIEILSDSTERADRGDKFDCYETLESLTDYVLISQDAPRIEHYARMPAGGWHYVPARGLEAVLSLPAIGCELRLADVYARVPFLTPSKEMEMEAAQAEENQDSE